MKGKIKEIISIILIILVIVIIGIVIRNLINISNDREKEIPAEEKYSNIKNISTYDNPIVPEGFTKVETDTASWEQVDGKPKGWDKGLVIKDNIGNEFVWVPFKENINLKEYTLIGDFIFYDNGKGYSIKEFIQLLKYQGYYVSRYEIGLPDEIINNTNTFSKETNNKEGVPVSKKGRIVWNFIDWNIAKSNAKNMYNNEIVKSDLITNGEWDNLVNWITEEDYRNSNEYGNYVDSNFNFTGYYSIDYGATYNYGENVRKEVYNMILSTGSTERNKNKNIYDLAGNVLEFTDMYKYKNEKDKIVTSYNTRGGFYDEKETSIREIDNVSDANSRQGFRVVLYME